MGAKIRAKANPFGKSPTPKVRVGPSREPMAPMKFIGTVATRFCSSVFQFNLENL